MRYLGTADVQSNSNIRFGILTNGRYWRLYDHKARSRLAGFVEIDLNEAVGLIVPADTPTNLQKQPKAISPNCEWWR